jgi:hypothetical protein
MVMSLLERKLLSILTMDDVDQALYPFEHKRISKREQTTSFVAELIDILGAP